MPESWRLLTGDCLDVLATLEPDSVDACATDPPYGISFMGREWDTFTPATVEKMRTPKAFGADDANPNLRGRTGWAGSAAIAYDRSAAASLKFHAWTQQWAEAVLRVLKPGAHAVVCASPRMGHRVTCGLEDAGFEIRDSLLWLYGSGFPKSLNVGKQLDRRPGVTRQVEFAAHLKARREATGLSRADVDKRVTGHAGGSCWDWERGGHFPPAKWWPALRDVLDLDPCWESVLAQAEREVVGTRQKDRLAVSPGQGSDRSPVTLDLTTPATDLAHQWDGWGTALKPAYEPVILARKPLGGRTVAQCVAAFGTGALNIDGCRLSTDGRPQRVGDYKDTGNNTYAGRMDGSLRGGSRAAGTTDLGRWPPNVALDETAAARLDAEGGASRFFYVAKASREERERGCENLPQRTAGEATDRQDGSAGLNSPRAGASRTRGARNHHPTVKPVTLMRWLVRLVTPPGGLVLDPFAGSGTTGLACIKEQCRFLGIEREAEYVAIADARLRAEHARYETGGPLFAETAEPADGLTMATTYQL